MRIILEGPDGSGKSTLARTIAEALGLSVERGRGPEKYPGEIQERVASYIQRHNHENTILDRHPAVSHPIYSRFSKAPPLPAVQLWTFYQLPSLFIYCKGGPLDNHETNEHDTPQHLRLLAENHTKICEAYDDWAYQRAHVFYDWRNHTTDDIDHIIKIARGVLNRG